MTSVVLSDSEDVNDDSFDLFRTCGQRYLELRNACRNIDIDTFQKEVEGIVPKCDLEISNIHPVEDRKATVKKRSKPPADTVQVLRKRTTRSAMVVIDSVPPAIQGHRRRATRSQSDSVTVPPQTSEQRQRKRRRKKNKRAAPVVSSEVIVLDDSENESMALNISSEMDSFVEDDNYEMAIKVWWRFRDIHRFKIRKHQKLSSVFEYFSKLEDVPVHQILLTLHDTVNIQSSDTPGDLKLNIADVIEGGITTYKIEQVCAPPQAADGENFLQLKLLIKDRKEPMLVSLTKDQQMKVVMTKCAEQLDVPLSKLRFFFDGDVLKASDVPEDLDLEGGECIDVQIIS